MLKRKRIDCRPSTGFLSGAVLAGLLLALLAGLPAAQAANLHREAKRIQIGPSFPGSNAPAPTTQTVVDHQWYVVPGGFNGVGDRYVTIGRIAVPVACKSSEPLLASLYNPAGYFIRRVRPTSNGTFRFAGPRLDGRYLLKLGVADPTCSGLRHSIVESVAPSGARGDSSLTAQVQECTLAKKKVDADNSALRRRHSAASGKRYHGFLKRDKAAQRVACKVNA